jgi:iron complex outermembrane recepter protein
MGRRALSTALACVAVLIGAVTAIAAETPKTGAVEGRVLDSDGRPVPGLDVVLTGAKLPAGRRSVSAPPDGGFRFDGLEPSATYTVTAASADGAARAESTVTMTDAAPVRVDLRLQLAFSDAVTVTGTREAQLKRETPASVGTVTRDQLEQVRPSHPNEVMGLVPGVWVSTTGGEGHMTSIRQPLTTNPVYLYLEDGVPTRSTGFFNHNALYEVNVPAAEGIEVTRGPGSALYGSDAVGGVVNVITRSALGSSGASGQAETGGFGWRRLMAGGGLASSGQGIRGDVSLTHSDGWREATGYDRQAGTLRWDRVTPNSRWKAAASYSHIDQQTAGSSTLQLEDYLTVPTRNLTPISFRQVTAFRVSAEYERQMGGSSFELIPYGRYDEMGLLPNWSLTYDPTVYTTQNTSFGLLAKARHDFAAWRTQIVAGFDLDVSPGEHVENQILPQTTRTPNGKTVFSSYTTGPLIYDYAVTFVGAAPYGQVEFSPSSRLRATAGVRYDRNSFDYTDRLSTPPTARYLRPADTTVSYGQVSPKVGLTYQLSDAANLFASYRHAFRAPSEGQLFRQGSTADTIGLKPVRADNYEAGLRLNLARTLSVDLAAYRLDKHDDILSYRDPATGATSVLNAGRTSHEGIELGVQASPARWLRLTTAYSHAVHTYVAWAIDPARGIDYSGNEMETAPRDLGSATVTVIPARRVTVSAEVVYLGPYWMDAANTARYGGHTLVNARAQATVLRGVTLFARVMNVADRLYAESTSYTLARGQEFAPGRPRTLFVGLDLGWVR